MFRPNYRLKKYFVKMKVPISYTYPTTSIIKFEKTYKLYSTIEMFLSVIFFIRFTNYILLRIIRYSIRERKNNYLKKHPVSTRKSFTVCVCELRTRKKKKNKKRTQKIWFSFSFLILSFSPFLSSGV